MEISSSKRAPSDIDPSTRPVTPNIFSTNENDEIARAWKVVQDRVLLMADGDHTKIKRELNIDDVLGYLDQAQTADKKSSEASATIKKVFSRTLQFIETVGGILADGVSNVSLNVSPERWPHLYFSSLSGFSTLTPYSRSLSLQTPATTL